MKIRNGFVSNSSSSSFVVAFPKKPMTIKDVKEMLFGKEEYFPTYYPRDDQDKLILTTKIARTVFNDIKSQRPNDKKSIYGGFEGWLDGAPSFPDDWRNGSEYVRRKKWDKYEKESIKYRNKCANKFIKENKNTFIYVFSYSDNDGNFYSTMEHGGIFDKLNHRRISRH